MMAQIKNKPEPIFSSISFCDKQVDNIINDTLKKSILDNLEENYNVNIKQKNYVILKKEYLPNLKKNHHVLTTRSKGNSYYLYLTRLNNVNSCFYIDKKTKEGFDLPRIVSVNYHFDNSLYDNTLFEGELIKIEDNNWLFLLSDLLIFKGVNYTQNIITKHNKMYHILTNEYVPDENDICPFHLKKIFNPYEIEEVLDNFIPKLNYPIYGLTFHPLNKKHNNLLYVFPHMIKNKSNDSKKNEKEAQNKVPKKKSKGIEFIINPEKEKDRIEINNIDIWKQIEETIKKKEIEIRLGCYIKKTDIPDIFNLYILDNENQEFCIGIAHIQTLSTSQYINNLFNDKPELDKLEIECQYDTKFKKWKPLNNNKKNISISSFNDIQL